MSETAYAIGTILRGNVDVEVAAREVATLKQELRNLAKAIASGGEQMPELMAEMKRRSDRVRLLEADLAAARRTPKMIEELLSRVEASADRRLNELRASLEARSGTPEAQELFRSVYPDGLEFIQIEKGRRKIWRVKGVGVLTGFELDCDPPDDLPASRRTRRDPSPPENRANRPLTLDSARSSSCDGDPDGI